MNADATVVIHGFFALPNREKLKVVEAINEYFDSMDRDPIRAGHDERFKSLGLTENGIECICCGRKSSAG